MMGRGPFSRKQIMDIMHAAEVFRGEKQHTSRSTDNWEASKYIRGLDNTSQWCSQAWRFTAFMSTVVCVHLLIAIPRVTHVVGMRRLRHTIL
jgi:hypothetical protein